MNKYALYSIPVVGLLLLAPNFVSQASETTLEKLEREYQKIEQQELDNLDRKDEIACEAAILRINECWKDRTSSWCDEAYSAVIAFYDNSQAYFEDVCITRLYDGDAGGARGE